MRVWHTRRDSLWQDEELALAWAGMTRGPIGRYLVKCRVGFRKAEQLDWFSIFSYVTV